MSKNIKKVANTANISDKQSWNRKYDNLQTLISKVNSIGDKILELESSKSPIIDEIAILRERMIKECIHPQEFLTDSDGQIICKFCNKKFNIQ
jgi:hypothetical protein